MPSRLLGLVQGRCLQESPASLGIALKTEPELAEADEIHLLMGPTGT